MSTALKNTLLTGATLCVLFSASVSEAQAESFALPTGPYSKELYDLGYSVFLANNNAAEALLVAEKALVAVPGDMEWLNRAAQAAEWSNNPSRALAYYFALARKGESVALDKAIVLAGSLGDFERKKQLLAMKLKHGDEKTLREYLVACEVAGRPVEALQVMESPLASWSRTFVLAERARLYSLTGRPAAAISTWYELAQHRPLTADEALQRTSLLYGMGKLRQAWEALQSASLAMKSAETQFWQTYSDLGWNLNHRDESATASQQLIDQGAGRLDDFQRVAEQYMDTAPERSYTAALAGWRGYHTPYLFSLLSNSGERLGRWDQLKETVDGLTDKERKQLSTSPSFWMFCSRMYQHFGNAEQSITCARQALRLAPDNEDIAANYLWTLMNLEQNRELQETVRLWESRYLTQPLLIMPLGAAFNHLGDTQRALYYYQLAYARHGSDPLWLTSYADLLDMADMPGEAFSERMKAITLVQKGKTVSLDSVAKQRLTAQLMLNVRQGDDLDRLMERIARGEEDDTTRELLVAWALSTERRDTARFLLWKAYLRNAKQPAWARLSQALAYNDRESISELLAVARERLPYRDAIEGAIRVGSIPLAETMAFERFQQHDRDYLLDSQLRDLYGDHPAWFKYRAALSSQSKIGMLENSVACSLPLTNRLSFSLAGEDLEIRPQNSSALGVYPRRSVSGLAALSYRHNQGSVTVEGGITDGLYLHPTAAFLSDWRLNSSQTLDLAFHWGTTATETVPLRIGGLKNELALGLLTNVTPRDAFMVRLAGRELRDQQQRPLGEGYSVEGEINHRLLVSWPDIGLRAFGGYHYYARTARPVADTLSLLPAGASVDGTFYVPETFTIAGGGITAGQLSRKIYNRRWRPFAAVDVSWNSTSGTGFHYELGFNGPLFGLDVLDLAFSQDSGSFGASDLASRIELNYHYYFN